MKIRYLLADELLKSSDEILELDVSRCTSNFREADDKSLLFLLPGINFNTYSIIDEYTKTKAVAIVTEDASKISDKFQNIIEVRNARKSFAHAMSEISQIDYKSMSFIGITGTNGKTSTATLIYNILCKAEIPCGFIGTGKIFFNEINYADKNYSMTSPDPDILYPILHDMQKRGCSVIVIEASSHALALDKLSPIPFKVGIFTGISHEHLEFHKTMENYFEAKEKLILKSEHAIINYDDEYGKKLYEKYKSKAIGIGMIWSCDSQAIDIESHGVSGTSYIYKSKTGQTKIELSIPGLYNIYNSMLAYEAAYKMNVCIDTIKSALKETKHIDGRFEVISSDVTVIIDYAHTPLALESLLKTVNTIKNTGQKTTLIFGCGGERDPSKRPLMAAVAEKFADKIIVTSDNPRSEDENKIYADIERGFENKDHGIIRDRRLAIEYAIKSADINEIIVIAGKGHEKYIKDKNGVHDFDEKSIVKSSLELRKKG